MLSEQNMPVAFLDRLPLPNLRVYTAASVLALSGCIYFAQQTVSKGALQNQMNRGNATQDAVSVGQKVGMMFAVMVREPMCVWVSFENCGAKTIFALWLVELLLNKPFEKKLVCKGTALSKITELA